LRSRQPALLLAHALQTMQSRKQTDSTRHRQPTNQPAEPTRSHVTSCLRHPSVYLRQPRPGPFACCTTTRLLQALSSATVL
jgi:hypothetical protein